MSAWRCQEDCMKHLPVPSPNGLSLFMDHSLLSSILLEADWCLLSLRRGFQAAEP